MSCEFTFCYAVKCDRCGRSAGPYRTHSSFAKDDAARAEFRQLLNDNGNLIDKHVCPACCAELSPAFRASVTATTEGQSDG